MDPGASNSAEERTDLRLSRKSPAATRVVLHYGVAILSVAVALAITFPLRAYIYTVPMFFAAVLVSCWYGGVGPGVVATIASSAAIHFILRLPRPGSVPDGPDIARLVQFIFTAAVTIR